MSKAYNYFYNHARCIDLRKNTPVAVNRFSLRVGNRVYPLDEISKFGLEQTVPNRIPGATMLIVGIALLTMALFHFNYLGHYFSIRSEMLLCISLALSLFGLILLCRNRKKYVLKVVLGSEEMDVVASPNKNQVGRIVNALSKELDKVQSGSAGRPYTWTI
ncbi:MAG TPA: DUF6232 family protein [Cyclobacteriaceae bacterium]|nr:DUF6232 family protein [Cyclobacteriaceae bacterium]